VPPLTGRCVANSDSTAGMSSLPLTRRQGEREDKAERERVSKKRKKTKLDREKKPRKMKGSH